MAGKYWAIRFPTDRYLPTFKLNVWTSFTLSPSALNRLSEGTGYFWSHFQERLMPPRGFRSNILVIRVNGMTVGPFAGRVSRRLGGGGMRE